MSEHAGRPLNMFAALLLCVSAVPLGAFVDELDDSLLETRRTEDIWLIKFYAPWCSMCKQLDPLWHRIGSELKSAGSHVNVGKCDAVANAGELAFVVLSLLCLHGNAPTARQAWRKSSKFAAIPPSSWKKDVKYPHIGPLTEDAIVKFVHRVSGPLIRPLTSVKLFQHALSHHDVMFVYIGASSPLKGVFSGVAQEMIVSTFFFSAGRDVLPKAVSLPALPAVVVFKDGGYFSYNEMSDGSLKAWIKRERFSNYAKVDSYTLKTGPVGAVGRRRREPTKSPVQKSGEESFPRLQRCLQQRRPLRLHGRRRLHQRTRHGLLPAAGLAGDRAKPAGLFGSGSGRHHPGEPTEETQSLSESDVSFTKPKSRSWRSSLRLRCWAASCWASRWAFWARRATRAGRRRRTAEAETTTTAAGPATLGDKYLTRSPTERHRRNVTSLSRLQIHIGLTAGLSTSAFLASGCEKAPSSEIQTSG
ncbi:protein disulfide-isomerase TMX3-like isoform X5 [Syngnathoides biaculeatus]|uniref:protein disulfide-isomerase TMX3-like isoform X5 n=1 Tax=Syngnathoides biaculeatus TaxID=300417 RepID=UPI002ADE9532|nr:protein disulfide-isomerase TMX3-like isoform X5 [Syngnathoides biaculeatus]